MGAGAVHTEVGMANVSALISVAVKEAMSATAMKIFLNIVQYPCSCRAQLLIVTVVCLIVYEKILWEVTSQGENLIQHHKCCPMEWVGIFLSDNGFRLFKCLTFIPMALFGCQLLIKCSHEFCCHFVADTP